MIENFGAWHNLPFATKANGFGGLDTELKFNDAAARQAHPDAGRLDARTRRFVYGGREGKSTALFTAGECAMHIASSGSACGASRRRCGTDKVGIAMMPYSPDVARQAAELDHRRRHPVGAAGPAEGRIQGRRQVLHLSLEHRRSRPSGTRRPATCRSPWPPPRLTEKAGFYKKFPGRDVAVKELTLNPPTENSKGLRIGNFVQIRDVVDEELETVWSGKKDAKTALDDAVKRGNELLSKFEAANK